VNVFGFFSYILVPSVETFSHFKTTILLVFLKAFFCFGFYVLKVFLGFLKTGKAFLLCPSKVKKAFPITSRSSTAHFVRSTVCKLPFCGFATQKYSTKNQLTTCG
jgi:hypothetical protein